MHKKPQKSAKRRKKNLLRNSMKPPWEEQEEHSSTYPSLQTSSLKPCTLLELQKPSNRVLPGFRPLCTAAAAATTTPATSLTESDLFLQPLKHSIFLERLRLRHLKDSAAKSSQITRPVGGGVKGSEDVSKKSEKVKNKKLVENFEELGLSEEVMGAVREMGIEVPTEIQCIGIPAVLEAQSVVLGSHTGSGKTLAYLLPLFQLLRRDETMWGMIMKPKRPRAVVLCTTRELSEQVFRVAKSISHHARFRCTMVSGGGQLRLQEDSLSNPIDMVVGTPGRVLQHIEESNMVYGDIKFLQSKSLLMRNSKA